MADAAPSHAPQPKGATGVLVLADGTVVWGRGFGATAAQWAKCASTPR